MGFLANLFRARETTLSADAEALLSVRGEASAVTRASELLAAYARLEAEEKLRFLMLLAERFSAEPKRLEKAMAAYQAKPDAQSARALHDAAEPRRQELLRRLNLAPGGTASLVSMREDVLRGIPVCAELVHLDADFKHLFASWFNRGFLVLRRIDWGTPAAILEKVIRYEAVHEINGWPDLRRRLDPGDRKCFAFFHPALAGEPLIFVEVALMRHVPQAIAPLLAEDREPLDPRRAKTAVFYSISNCQAGLKGISFGNFLIKQVVEDLKRELPHLKTFVTLSPVPGFAAWLQRERESRTAGAIPGKDRAVLRALDDENWLRSAESTKSLKPALLRAAAHYFLDAKTASGKPLDPVARFHLGNGASLESINWMGDASPKGMREGAGIMVNYLYDLRNIEENHEALENKGEVIASRRVRNLRRHRAEPPVPV